ncbi:MAG TPA: hypothetical protein VK986_25295, partial [Tepidisphaeraceae bacterium]|nr:hypothetical protein [Tepidisphaeraceae bacterium]
MLRSSAWILSLVTLPSLAADAPLAERFAAELTAGSRTVALLRADTERQALVDRTGRFAPAVTGGTVVADEQFGACLKLSGEANAGITLKDDGKLSFEGGLTIDMWVYLEGPTGPARGAQLALKAGSFAWDLNNGKLNTTWLAFPAEPVFTDAPRQFKT